MSVPCALWEPGRCWRRHFLWLFLRKEPVPGAEVTSDREPTTPQPTLPLLPNVPAGDGPPGVSRWQHVSFVYRPARASSDKSSLIPSTRALAKGPLRRNGREQKHNRRASLAAFHVRGLLRNKSTLAISQSHPLYLPFLPSRPARDRHILGKWSSHSSSPLLTLKQQKAYNPNHTPSDTWKGSLTQ